MDLSNVRVKELIEHLFNIYRNIFGKGVTNEKEALFANALIDYNRRALTNSMSMGIRKEFLPIAEISIWQYMVEGRDAYYTVRVETAGGDIEKDNNLNGLVDTIQEAIDKWGDESFDGFVTVSSSGEENTDEVGWVLPQSSKKEKNDK